MNLVDILGRLDGRTVAGGCGDCQAEQHISFDAGWRCWKITISHDDWCPTWRAIEQRRRQGGR